MTFRSLDARTLWATLVLASGAAVVSAAGCSSTGPPGSSDGGPLDGSVDAAQDGQGDDATSGADGGGPDSSPSSDAGPDASLPDADDEAGDSGVGGDAGDGAQDDSGSGDGSVDGASDGGAPGTSPEGGAEAGTTDGGTGDPLSVCLTCGPNEKPYHGVCISALNPDTHCGTYDSSAPCNLPHAVAACAGGACAVGSCEPGWADCNGNPGDGCEADLSSPQTCTSCSQACASGQLCTPTGCAPACTPPLTKCNDRCVDLSTSPYDCGACGATKSGPTGTFPTCTGGVQGSTPCQGSLTSCNGSCVDVSSDPSNCGQCGNRCPGPMYTDSGAGVCKAGSCVACAQGFVQCFAGGDCTSLASDPYNCGACNHACAGSEMCVAGACQPASSLWLVTGLSAPEDIALDASNVYWTDTGNGTVATVPKSGGAVVTLATGQAKPVRLALDASYVYWSNNLGGAIMRAPKDGSSPPQLVAPASEPYDLVVVGGTMYWADKGSGTSGLGTIQEAPAAGGSPSTFFAPQWPGVSTLVTDGSYLYSNGMAISLASGAESWSVSSGNAWALYGGRGYYNNSGPDFESVDLSSGSDPRLEFFFSTFDKYPAPGEGVAAYACGIVYAGTTLNMIPFTSMSLVSLSPSVSTAQARRVALDDAFIYWTDATEIGKVPLPR